MSSHLHLFGMSSGRESSDRWVDLGSEGQLWYLLRLPATICELRMIGVVGPRNSGVVRVFILTRNVHGALMRTSFWPRGLRVHLCVVTVISVLVGLSTCGAEEKRAIGRFVVAGFLDGRQKLRSGVCEVTGSRVTQNEGRNANRSTEVRVFIAFDLDARVYRFDRSESSTNESNPTPTSRGWRYVRTPDRVFSRNLESNQITVHDVATPPNRMVAPSDIAAIGLLNYTELQSTQMTAAALFDENGLLSDSRLTSALDDGDGVYKLLWTNRTFARAIWFDERQGMCPVRLEQRIVESPASLPIDQSDAVWEEIGGVWLPQSVQVAQQLGGEVAPAIRVPRLVRTVAYSFRWESVNEPVSPSLFDIAALSDPGEPAPSIVDFRLAQPIVIQEPRGASADNDGKAGASVLRHVFVLVATILFVAAVSLVSWRKRTVRK